MNAWLNSGVAVLFLLSMAQPEAQEKGPGSQVIERLNEALLDVMKNADTLGYKGRYDKLAPIIKATHGLDYIGRFSIGRRNWKALDDSQRKRFIDVFIDYSIANYAGNFNGYDGETFSVVSEEHYHSKRASKKDWVQVGSVLKIPTREDVNFVYVLRPVDGHWEIVNISYDGISDLARKTAEYKPLIIEQGVEALINHISQETARIARSPSN